MPRSPSDAPRDLLVQPGAWDTDDPEIRSGIEPRVATAVRVQRLARQLEVHRRANGLKKSELAAELHVTTAHLHRMVDGLGPLTLLQACAIADLLGLELRWVPRATRATHDLPTDRPVSRSSQPRDLPDAGSASAGPEPVPKLRGGT